MLLLRSIRVSPSWTRLAEQNHCSDKSRHRKHQGMTILSCGGGEITTGKGLRGSSNKFCKIDKRTLSQRGCECNDLLDSTKLLAENNHKGRPSKHTGLPLWSNDQAGQSVDVGCLTQWRFMSRLLNYSLHSLSTWEFSYEAYTYRVQIHRRQPNRQSVRPSYHRTNHR